MTREKYISILETHAKDVLFGYEVSFEPTGIFVNGEKILWYHADNLYDNKFENPDGRVFSYAAYNDEIHAECGFNDYLFAVKVLTEHLPHNGETVNKNFYSIFGDIPEFRKFLNWLPELTETETYYISLLARKKYNAVVSNNNQQLKRNTGNKQSLERKIRQMELVYGAYQIGDIPIPKDSLACYINVNPRDYWKASTKTLQELASVVCRGDKRVDPQKLTMNNLQNAASENRRWYVFDIDDEKPETLHKAFDIVGKMPYITTRGGYHVMVDAALTKSYPKDWYQSLKAISDATGDGLSPIPGTFQGGHLVTFTIPE